MSGEADLPRELREILDQVGGAQREAASQALQDMLRTEAELRDATDRMSKAQRIADFGDWEWDMDEDRLTWSDELYRIFGVERQRFAANFESYLELVHPHDRQRVRDEIAMAVSNGSRFVFEHDWTAFSAAQTDAKTRVRRVTRLDVTERRSSRGRGRLVEITVSADGFLRYMVRSIAGALLAVGRGEADAAAVRQAIETGRRPHVFSTAPAHGLTLVEVHYE